MAVQRYSASTAAMKMTGAVASGTIATVKGGQAQASAQPPAQSQQAQQTTTTQTTTTAPKKQRRRIVILAIIFATIVGLLVYAYYPVLSLWTYNTMEELDLLTLTGEPLVDFLMQAGIILFVAFILLWTLPKIGKFIKGNLTGGTMVWIAFMGIFIPAILYFFAYWKGDPELKFWWINNFKPYLAFYYAFVAAVALVVILGSRKGKTKQEVGHYFAGGFAALLAIAIAIYTAPKMFPHYFQEAKAAPTRVQPRVHPAFTAEGSTFLVPTEWSRCVPIPDGYNLMYRTENPGILKIVAAAYFHDGTIKVYQGFFNEGMKPTKCIRFRSIVGEPVPLKYWYNKL